VGDDEDAGEVALDGVDGFDEALAALGVLAAEAFVNDEGLKAGAGAFGEDLGEGEADGEVDAEFFAAALVFVGAGARDVADLDLQSLGQCVAALELALGF
jgi:hypothetical protein